MFNNCHLHRRGHTKKHGPGLTLQASRDCILGSTSQHEVGRYKILTEGINTPINNGVDFPIALSFSFKYLPCLHAVSHTEHRAGTEQCLVFDIPLVNVVKRPRFCSV